MSESDPTTLGEIQFRAELIANDAIFAQGRTIPLTFIAFGGFLGVSYFHSRETTQDLDFFYPGIVEEDGSYHEPAAGVDAALEDHIAAVAREQHLPADWANSAVSNFFEGLPDESAVVGRSMQQGFLVYSSPQLRIYAASWSFQLVQKLAAMRQRTKWVDILDAAYLGRELHRQLGRPMMASELRAEWCQPPRMEVVQDEAIEEVNVKSMELFGHIAVGIH
ncbi:hypothetical protein C8R47DRAFT_1070960 [Mycena vitilis]|nr:hypothetical protein C8R47DRAFT_1070960 [Mycena vitilis]